MKKILSIIACIILSMILFGECHNASTHNASWLVMVTVLLVLCSLLTRNKLKNFMIVSIILAVALPAIIAVGTADRKATQTEENSVINYLGRYKNNSFDIVDSRFINEEADNGFQGSAFSWNHYEMSVKDKNGCVFTVYGSNEGFNHITSFADDYYIVQAVQKYFGNSTENMKVTQQEMPAADGTTTKTAELSFDVNCRTASKSDFSENRELSAIQSMKFDILGVDLLDNITIVVTYRYSDGEIIFNQNRFEK